MKRGSQSDSDKTGPDSQIRAVDGCCEEEGEAPTIPSIYAQRLFMGPKYNLGNQNPKVVHAAEIKEALVGRATEHQYVTSIASTQQQRW